MQGSTHSLAGMVTGLQIAAGFHLDPTQALVIAGFATFGALLPDIDHTASTIGRRLRLISTPTQFVFKHRGVTHSLLALFLVTLLFVHYHPLYGLALGAGYASHLIGDMMTRAGILLVWPVQASCYLLPKPMRLKTGGITERIIYLTLLTILLWFAWQFWIKK